MILYDNATREEWYKNKLIGVGSSEAGTVINANRWKSSEELFLEKTGQKEKEYVSNKYTTYGIQAEQFIRELFKLEHPEYECDYHQYRVFQSRENSFMYAIVDGELKEQGRKGVLEIKTVSHGSQEWQVPRMYYAQVLHSMECTESEFAVLVARIKIGFGDVITKHFKWERSDVQNNINWLISQEKLFWERVQEYDKGRII